MSHEDPASLRASDKDRESAAEVLREAAGEGRLSMTELDERLDAVYEAKTYAELEPIVRALPHRAITPDAGASRRTSPRWWSWAAGNSTCGRRSSPHRW